MVYLKDEPVILTVPAISDRYHSVELADFMMTILPMSEQGRRETVLETLRLSVPAGRGNYRLG